MSVVVYREFVRAIRRGDRRAARAVALTAVKNGLPVADLYVEVLQPALYEVGHLWMRGEMSVAEEHAASAIVQQVIQECVSYAPPRQARDRTVVAACIGNEQHEIGMQMIVSCFDLDGWIVYYLGHSVPHHDIVQVVGEWKPDVVAISATLDEHIAEVVDLIYAIRASGHGREVAIMVGGQPFNDASDLVAAVGADLTARSARDAVWRANQFLDQRPERQPTLPPAAPKWSLFSGTA